MVAKGYEVCTILGIKFVFNMGKQRINLNWELVGHLRRCEEDKWTKVMQRSLKRSSDDGKSCRKAKNTIGIGSNKESST